MRETHAVHPHPTRQRLRRPAAVRRPVRIKGGLAGTAPELGSPDLVAITAYLGSIAKDQRVEIGGAPK
jgi:hypothetical protein